MSTKTKTTLTATAPDGTTVTRATARKYAFVVMSRMTAEAIAEYADRADRLSEVVTEADRAAHDEAGNAINQYLANRVGFPWMPASIEAAYELRHRGPVGAAESARRRAEWAATMAGWADVSWASNLALAQKAATPRAGYEVVIVPVN